MLGNEFALDQIPLPGLRRTHFCRSTIWRRGPVPEVKTFPVPYRAMVCEPVDGHVVSRHGVWLFSEVGFGLDAAARIVWDTRGRGDNPAAFHYFHGCFWLRNDWLPASTLSVNDAPLNPGISCRWRRADDSHRQPYFCRPDSIAHPPRMPGSHLALEAIVCQDDRLIARCLLRRGRYVIGHDRKNEIVADAESISAKHARLTVASDEEFSLEDLGSANGTFVDGRAIRGRYADPALESKISLRRE